MKKALFILVAMLAITFTGCDKTDSRDPFLGTYAITVNGSVTYNDYAHTTTPITANDYITITKESWFGNVVHVSGYFNADASISGNRIQLNPETVSKSVGNKLITYTFTHREGSLIGNTLTFVSNIDGTEEQVIGSTYLNFAGQISTTAVK